MRCRLLFLTVWLVTVLLGCQSEVVSHAPHKERPAGIVLAGSGSNLPVMAKLIQAYQRDKEVTISLPSSIGSGGAIKAIEEGAIDVGLTSRPLSTAEKRRGLKELPYGRVAIIFGTNTNVTDGDVSAHDLVEIYQGKKTTWSNGEMIVVLMREKGDSSNLVLERVVPGFQTACTHALEQELWQVYYTDAEALEAIMKIKNSIGSTDSGAVAALKPDIGVLSYNGVEPSLVQLSEAKYPLYKDLYFVYKGSLSPEVEDFLNFVYGQQGAKILAENGTLPLERQGI